MVMEFCPDCGTRNPPERITCQLCGVDIKPAKPQSPAADPYSSDVPSEKFQKMTTKAVEETFTPKMTQDATTTCTVCSTSNPVTNKFCRTCGNQFSPPEPKNIVCRNCGKENDIGTKFCGGCGSQLGEARTAPAEPEMVACSKCGRPNKPGTKFCGYCGDQLTTATSQGRPSQPQWQQEQPANNPRYQIYDGPQQYAPSAPNLPTGPLPVLSIQEKVTAVVKFDKQGLAAIGYDQDSTKQGLLIIFVYSLISRFIAAGTNQNRIGGISVSGSGVGLSGLFGGFIILVIGMLVFSAMTSWTVRGFGGKIETSQTLTIMGFSSIWLIFGSFVSIVLPSLDFIFSLVFLASITLGISAVSGKDAVTSFFAIIVAVILAVIIIVIFYLVIIVFLIFLIFS